MAGEIRLNDVSIATESGGTVTLGNATLGSTVVLGTNASPIASNLVLAAGNGIDFSAASGSAAGSSSAVLDDYEQGTFVPVYKASVTDPTVAGYSFNYGFYIKIGKLVYFSLSLRGDISSVGTGNVLLGGLPFVVTGFTTAFAVGYYENWTTNGPTIAQGTISATDISLYRDNGGSGSRITVSNFKTGNASYNEVYVAGTYITN